MRPMHDVFLQVGEGYVGIPRMIVLVPKTPEVAAKPAGYQLRHLALELPADAFATASRRALDDALVAAHLVRLTCGRMRAYSTPRYM